MAEYCTFIQFRESAVIGLLCQIVKGGYRPGQAFSIPIPDDTDRETGFEQIGLKLREALLEKRKRPSHHCVLVLHRQDFAILNLELPPGTDVEITSMLELLLADQLPLGAGEICYGWERVNSIRTDSVGTDDRQSVQVYWAPLRKVSPITDELKKAGLDVMGVIPSAAAYRRLLSTECVLPLPQSNADWQEEGENRLSSFVHLTEDAFEFMLWDRDGRVVFSRGRQQTSSRQSKDRSQADKDIAKELANSIVTFRKQFPDWDVSTLTYLGPEIIPRPLKPHLDGRLEEETQNRIHHLIDKIGAGKGPEAEEIDRTVFLPLLAAAKMLEGADSKAHFNGLILHADMLPRHISSKREKALSRSLAIQSALLILGIVVLSIVNAWLYAHKMEAQLEYNKAEISKLTPIVRDIGAMEQRILSIREQIDYVISPADAILTLNKILAAHSSSLAGLYLDKMAFKASGLITLEGHSTNHITPWKFAEAIARGKILEIEQQPRIQTQPYGGAQIIRFHLILRANAKSIPSFANSAGADESWGGETN